MFYNNSDYKKMGDMNNKGNPITTALWGSMATHLDNEIKKYGTNKNKQDMLAEQNELKIKNKQNKNNKKQVQETVV